jgi:hypothetical protein
MVDRSIRAGLAALAALASLSAPAHAATSGSNGTHDPSRIVESNGKFYFCGTGGGCARSDDGLVWKQTGLRIHIPSWSTTYTNASSYSGHLGAGHHLYIYYSFCARPAAHAPCVVGLYTTPTLDSTASNFHLTDAGKVVNNPTNAGVRSRLRAAGGAGLRPTHGRHRGLLRPRDPTYNVAYGMGSSPMGPFTKPAVNPVLAKNDSLGIWARAITPYWPCPTETTTSRTIASRSRTATARTAKFA